MSYNKNYNCCICNEKMPELFKALAGSMQVVELALVINVKDVVVARIKFADGQETTFPVDWNEETISTWKDLIDSFRSKND